MQKNSAYGTASTSKVECEYELPVLPSPTNVSESLAVKKKACTGQLQLTLVNMTVAVLALVVSVAAVVLTVIVVRNQGMLPSNSIQALDAKLNKSNEKISTLQIDLKEKLDLIWNGEYILTYIIIHICADELFFNFYMQLSLV